MATIPESGPKRRACTPAVVVFFAAYVVLYLIYHAAHYCLGRGWVPYLIAFLVLPALVIVPALGAFVTLRALGGAGWISAKTDTLIIVMLSVLGYFLTPAWQDGARRICAGLEARLNAHQAFGPATAFAQTFGITNGVVRVVDVGSRVPPWLETTFPENSRTAVVFLNDGTTMLRVMLGGPTLRYGMIVEKGGKTGAVPGLSERAIVSWVASDVAVFAE